MPACRHVSVPRTNSTTAATPAVAFRHLSGSLPAPYAAAPTTIAITPMPAKYWYRSATNENCM